MQLVYTLLISRCKLLEKQEKLQFDLVREINSKYEMLKRGKEELKEKYEEASRKQKQLEE